MNRFPITLKTYGLITGTLVILNIIAYNVVLNNDGIYDPQTNFKNSIEGYIIVVPILCLPLGLLIALIPYKGLGYRQKRLAAIMFSYLFFNACVGVISGIRILELLI